MPEELKPCPLCGGKAKVSGKRAGNYRREGTLYYVICNTCRMRGPQYKGADGKYERGAHVGGGAIRQEVGRRGLEQAVSDKNSVAAVVRGREKKGGIPLMPISHADYFDAMRAAQAACTANLKTLEYSLLPPSAQELSGVVGLPAALLLVEYYGGLTLRIPHGETPQGRAMLGDIAKHIGSPATQALARKYAATALYIPNCKQAMQRARDAALLVDRKALAADGLSERQIVQCLALRYRLAERTIWRTLKRPAPPQPPPPQQQASLLA